MTTHSLLNSKSPAARSTLHRSLTALASVVIALGAASFANAQEPSPKEGMARCDQLYGAYSRYSGRVNYSHPVDVDVALENCRKGNFTAGIAGLTAALQRAAIPIPPVESAAAK